MLKRALAGVGAAAFVVVLACLADRTLSSNGERRVGEEAARKAHDAADWAREALAVQTESLALMTQNALANPRFQAALRGRVDSRTFTDLLATESWWEPYRGLRAAISYDGKKLAFAQTDGRDEARIREIVREVSASGKGATRLMSGTQGAFLVAASPDLPGTGQASAVLLLTRPLDDRVMETLAGRLGRPILVSDGHRPLARGGAEAGALLGAAVGQEASGDVALSDPAARAAAVEIGPGLWVWSVGSASAFEQATVVADRSRRQLLWAVAIPLAIAALSLPLRRSRKRPADAPPPAAPYASPRPGATRFGLPPASTLGKAVTTLAPGSAALPGPGMPLGRYFLVDQIGEGGMAEVFTAVSFGYGGFRRSFVIKRLRPELNNNTTAVDLFIDEANLASTLVHPNVVPVFDFGEATGSYFLAQEYVVGRDLGRLQRRLRDRGEAPLSTKLILYLAHEVLSGLQYAHDKRDDAGQPLGLVHRDITPENVMISDRGEVKILDFGIMKANQRVSQTESGTVKGSVGFMSPEQARGRVVDQRSDLFSVGMVILYTVSGEPIYQGETFYDLLTAAAAGPTDEHRARIAALAEPLPAILMRALEVDPDRRFQTSAEFAAAIGPFLASGAQADLAARLSALFGEELRAEQDRLVAAFSRAPSAEPFQGTGQT